MWKRLFFGTAVLCLTLVLPAVAPMAGEQAGKPAVILSVGSFEQLRGDLLYLAGFVGQDDNARLTDKLIEAQIGDGAIGAIDGKKPIGAYGWISAQDIGNSPFVVLVPIVEEKAFLRLLQNLDINAEKGDDGVYSAAVEKVPDRIYFRFANDYAYISARGKDVLDQGRLLAPAAMLPAGPVGALSLTMNIERIPVELRELVLGMHMTPTAQEVPGETEWQKKFRHVTAGESVNAVETAIKTLLNDGSETSLRLEMNRKAGDMTLTVSVGGKAGSTMAAAIRDLGKARSATLGLRTKDAAMSGELNFSLSDQLREVIGAGFEAGEGFYGFGSGARVSSIRASGAADRPDYSSVEMSGQLNFSLEGALWKAIGAAFNVGGGKVLLPTLKAAEHYGAFTLQGPGSDGLYTFVAGIQVKDGARLEETFRETVSTDSRTGVTIDIEKVGSVGIHRVGLTPVHDDARAVFGDGPLYFAFRDDTLLVAAGVNGLDILKEALAAAPVMGRLMELQMAIAKLAPLAGDKEAVEIAREVFRDDKDGDRLRLTLEGGDALKLQLSMKTKLIEYANRVGQAKK